MLLKHCTICKQSKPPSAFCKSKRERDGLNKWCRECSKIQGKEFTKKHPKYHLKTNHGITLDEYQRMFENQQGLCASCKLPPGKNALAVDHNHKTGKVRGLLCITCNTSLGILENIERVKNLLEYLKKYPM